MSILNFTTVLTLYSITRTERSMPHQSWGEQAAIQRVQEALTTPTIRAVATTQTNFLSFVDAHQHTHTHTHSHAHTPTLRLVAIS